MVKKKNKILFIISFIITVLIFFLGLLFGFFIESLRETQINQYYLSSEFSFFDGLALNDLININSVNCSYLINSTFTFADKIYNEAILLEDYENSEQLKDGMLFLHKKYDLLRTYLWINNLIISKKCDINYDTIIYLYEHNTKDLNKQATQNVWSNLLYDVKKQKNNSVLLIPIAVDMNITSLNGLLLNYNISSFPSVVINDGDKIFSNLVTLKEFNSYLK